MFSLSSAPTDPKINHLWLADVIFITSSLIPIGWDHLLFNSFSLWDLMDEDNRCPTRSRPLQLKTGTDSSPVSLIKRSKKDSGGFHTAWRWSGGHVLPDLSQFTATDLLESCFTFVHDYRLWKWDWQTIGFLFVFGRDFRVFHV